MYDEPALDVSNVCMKAEDHGHFPNSQATMLLL